MSVEKLKIAVMRRREDASRGFDIAVRTWVGTVLRAVRPILSIDCGAGTMSISPPMKWIFEDTSPSQGLLLLAS